MEMLFVHEKEKLGTKKIVSFSLRKISFSAKIVDRYNSFSAKLLSKKALLQMFDWILKEASEYQINPAIMKRLIKS